MGLVRARIELANAKDPAIKPMTVDSLVDTGALLLCVPEHVAVQLGLEELERREVTTADGTTHMPPYVGPVLVRFENRQCLTGALVLGSEVLLGAVPMEDMDVLVSPATRALIVNPDSPDFARAIVKAVAPAKLSAIGDKPRKDEQRDGLWGRSDRVRHDIHGGVRYGCHRQRRPRAG